MKWKREEQSPFLTLILCLWLPSAREVLVQECQNQSPTMKNPRLYLPLGVDTRGKMLIANHAVVAQKTATEWVTSLWYSFWKSNSRHSESFSLFSVSKGLFVLASFYLCSSTSQRNHAFPPLLVKIKWRKNKRKNGKRKGWKEERKEGWDRGVGEKERGRKNEKGKGKGEKNKRKTISACFEICLRKWLIKWLNQFLSNFKNSNCHQSLWVWIHFKVL